MVVLSGAFVRRLGGSLRLQAFAVLIAVTESYFLGANWVYQTVTFDEATWMVALYCGRRTAQAILRDDWRSYPSSRLAALRESQSLSPLTMRVMPSLISATLKLMSKPRRLSANRR